jgi:hypothetical protein
MSRRQRLAIGVVLAGVALGACTASSPGPTPAPGGSAFEMIVLGPAPCPASVDGTNCVREGNELRRER